MMKKLLLLLIIYPQLALSILVPEITKNFINKSLTFDTSKSIESFCFINNTNKTKYDLQKVIHDKKDTVYFAIAEDGSHKLYKMNKLKYLKKVTRVKCFGSFKN